MTNAYNPPAGPGAYRTLSALVLALLATPGGLLDQVGLASPWPITRTQWSWFANLLNYGVVGGFFLLAAESEHRQQHRGPLRAHDAGDQ